MSSLPLPSPPLSELPQTQRSPLDSEIPIPLSNRSSMRTLPDDIQDSLKVAYLRRSEYVEKKRIAGTRMKEVLNDYAGSRQDFFEAHIEIEKVDKLIEELKRGSRRNSFASLAVDDTPHTIYGGASTHSSMSRW